PVLAAREAVLEELETGPLRIPHQLDPLVPLVLLDAAEKHPTVAALDEVERLDRFLPEPRRHQSHVWPVLEGQLENRGDALLDRDLDVLPQAGSESLEQRAQGRQCRVDSTLEAGLAAEGLERGHLGGTRTATVQRRDAACAPHHEITGVV